MISVVYCTRESNPNHKEHIIKTSGLHKHIEVIEIINNGESLTSAYNRGYKLSKNNIVVFCHDDIIIETKQWGKKLKKHFDKEEHYGIIGVAGSKYLPKSGRWWEKPKWMYGRVKHTHNGNSWLSEYSPDLGIGVEDVVNVDGLFFAVHKDRLYKDDNYTPFDERVKGFHFYDVDFCFKNFVSGVSVGVITNIRINHMSIGETNEEWEKNREQFVEIYGDVLPLKVDDKFRNRKLKVLIGCLNFQGLTGSEISTMELAKGLSKNGCEVYITSQIGKSFKIESEKHNIKVYPIQEPPGFKLGDGKWYLNTPQGQVVSRPNTLYKVKEMNFDIIHANHTPITQRLLQLYPNNNFVNIVRSEVIDLENPIVDEKIKRYIAIRPSIKDYIVNNFDISEDNVDVVYNLFDKSRFTPKQLTKGTEKKVTLFVGTMDYLRKNAILDLIDNVEELWLVGKDSMGYAKEFGDTYENVKYFPPTDNIEDFVNKCDETAGIFLGRTTIEGYLCGKPAWIYTVNKEGYVLDKEYTEVPEDMSIFDNDKIIEKYKEIYIDVYNEV
jgi:hypothetical protein